MMVENGERDQNMMQEFNFTLPTNKICGLIIIAAMLWSLAHDTQ